MTPEELRRHKGISFPGITTVFICHDGQGKIFLTKRSKSTRDEHGRWDPGGGGLKHGQTIEDNLRRELKEEYNAEALKLDFVGYYDVFRESPDGQPTHWVAFLFAVLVDPKKIRINEPEMIDGQGWFGLDDLPTPLHSQWPNILKQFKPRLQAAIGSTPSG